MDNINTVVLSGGGIKGISYIGFFKSLFSHIDPLQIKHYIATSAGCMFSLCLCIGYTVDEIQKILFNYNFDSMIPEINLDNLIFNFGLSDGLELEKMLIEILEYKKISKNITFDELYKLTNIKLTFAVTNFTLQKIEYWDYINNPNNKILDGLLATSRVPLFFTPYEINNNIYLDGGLINNYPINIIPIDNIECVIGACLTTKKEMDEIKNLFNINDQYDKIIMYILTLFTLTLESKMNLIDIKYLNRTVQLDNKLANFLDLSIDINIKNMMVNLAFEITENYLNNTYKLNDINHHKDINYNIDIVNTDINNSQINISLPETNNDEPNNDEPNNDEPNNDEPILI